MNAFNKDPSQAKMKAEAEELQKKYNFRKRSDIDQEKMDFEDGRNLSINLGSYQNIVNPKLIRLGFMDSLKEYISEDIRMVNEGLLAANECMRSIYVRFI